MPSIFHRFLTFCSNVAFLKKNIGKVKQGIGRIFDIGWQKGRNHGEYASYTRETKLLEEAGLKR